MPKKQKHKDPETHWLMTMLSAKDRELLRQYAMGYGKPVGKKPTEKETLEKLSPKGREELARYFKACHQALVNHQQNIWEHWVRVSIPRRKQSLQERMDKQKYLDPWLQNQMDRLERMERGETR